MMSDAETAYAMALAFELLPEPAQPRRAGDRLAELVLDSGYTIRTGFVGTPLICDALCSTGHYAAAYRLLTQKVCPSWLYQVTMGATTIREHWDSLLPNGSVNLGVMTSFNHYALGAVADWMQRSIRGIASLELGYRRIEICPRPGGVLKHAHASYQTGYGRVEWAWKIEDGKMDLDIVIPPNTTALVTLPGSTDQPVEVGSGSYHWSYPYQDPDYRAPYTVDDLVGEIMSDGSARQAVMDVIFHTQGAGFVGMLMGNERHMSLRELVSRVSNTESLLAAITDALAKLDSD
jgi:alpha-L-rhamnosidase